MIHKKRVLILSYSHLHSDPRVQRQIAALRDDFVVETCGYSGSGDPAVEFFQIYREPAFSLPRKLKRFVQYVTRGFDAYYWDDGKRALKTFLAARHYDAVIANDIHTLPLALGIAGISAKVYFDAHEYHPKEFEDNFKWRVFHQPYLEYLCKQYIPKASVFSTVAPGIARQYLLFTGREPLVITNASKYHELQPAPVQENPIRLIHHGAALRSRKIELMIDMANQLDERFCIDFMLISTDAGYIDFLKSLAKANPRIRFIDPVPVHEICMVTNSYDIGIFLLPPVNFNYLHALPNKLFEFVQARLATVVSPNPEMAALVNQYQLGIVSDDYSPESMAKAINAMTAEQIMAFKENANGAAGLLSAEENIRKIKDLVSSLIYNNK